MTFQEMARLHHACFGHQRAWPAAELADMLSRAHNFAVVQAKGFLIGSAAAGEAELVTLAVDPAARRQGTARALVLQFKDIAGQKGAEHAFLEVEVENAAAIALYKSCGFAMAGLRRAYYQRKDGARSDALVLSCPLSQQDPAF